MKSLRSEGHVVEMVHDGQKALQFLPEGAFVLLVLALDLTSTGRHITRSMLVEDVWSLSSEAVTNVVDVYVNYLRKKIDEGASIRLINTVRGVGFCFGPVDAPATTEANGSHPIA